ncbi:MAG TPA: hypothetical protein VEJ20_09605, partial [Candidatus Eremiobacteraceae bacterium]|nr:hypothetical protein [Candidatus Eremiobacteraceae bacterium]
GMATVPSCAYGGGHGPLLVQVMTNADVVATQQMRQMTVQMACSSQPASCTSIKAAAAATTAAQLFAAQAQTPGAKSVSGIGDRAFYVPDAVFALKGSTWIHVVLTNAALQSSNVESETEHLAKIAVSHVQ